MMRLILDKSDNLIVSGQTNVINFPVTPNAYQSSHVGNEPSDPAWIGDGFISIISSDTKSLLYSTYFGQEDVDNVFGMCMNYDTNEFYTVLTTESKDLSTSPDAFQTISNGDSNIRGQSDIYFARWKIVSQQESSSSSYTTPTTSTSTTQSTNVNFFSFEIILFSLVIILGFKRKKM